MKFYPFILILLLTPLANYCMEKEDDKSEKETAEPFLPQKFSDENDIFAELFAQMILSSKRARTEKIENKQPDIDYSINYSLMPLPFSDKTHEGVKHELATLLTLGSALPNAAQNGMLAIIKLMQQELETEHLSTWYNKKENLPAKKMYNDIIRYLLRNNVKKIDKIKNTSTIRDYLSNQLRVKLILKTIDIFKKRKHIQLVLRGANFWDKYKLEESLLYTNKLPFNKDLLILNSGLDPIKNTQQIRSAFLCLADINQRFAPPS